MSFASKFNKGRKFDVDVTGFKNYYQLKTLYNGVGEKHIYPVRAIFINTKGKYGPHGQVATDGYFVSLPGHMTDMCNQILEDAESVETINRGLVGFKIYTYTTPNSASPCYSIEWVDLAAGWKEEAVDLPAPDGIRKENPAPVDEGEETPFN